MKDSVEETLTYCAFPYERWAWIRTYNVIERLNRKIRRRTRVVGTFPDGNSALMLVCARLRHVAGTRDNKKAHEALGGDSGKRPYMLATSFNWSQQTYLRITIDSITEKEIKSPNKRHKFDFRKNFLKIGYKN